nr:immunoglobulin light chain junction region [Macaca mulatta]MOW28664.1 immunoglobulin light chain junction region [Macaca mulatta]
DYYCVIWHSSAWIF